ncbi:MAG: hypothetical protein EOP49_13630, partial [Sphingobacteriales bacterium]
MRTLIFIALSAIALTSCSKSETNPTNNSGIPTDGWKLDGTKHTQMYCVRQNNFRSLNAVDNDTSISGIPYSFSACFHEFPTTSGTYHVVALVVDSSGSRPGLNIADDEIIILATVPQAGQNNKSYWSTGADGLNATVTVTGGKIKVEVPEIDVTDGNNTVKT